MYASCTCSHSKAGNKGSRIAARLLTELAQRHQQAEEPTQDDDATQASQDMQQTPGQEPVADMRTLLEDAVVGPLVQHVCGHCACCLC